MKFGVAFPQAEIGTDPVAIRDFAQTAEGAGFDFLVGSDHVTGAHPDRFIGRDIGFPSPPAVIDTPVDEPLTLFGFLAGVTKRIELTTSILILPQRQAALVAKQTAEVDLLSSGRLRLGVAIGWNFTEYEAQNEDFHTRAPRFEEQITVLRKLWSEEMVTFEGRFHHLDRVAIMPRPERQIPIWVGGGLTEPVLKRIARLADGWMPFFPPDQDPKLFVDRMRSYLEQEHRDIAAFGVQTFLPTPPGSEAVWLKDAKRLQEVGATHLIVGGFSYARGVPPLEMLQTAISGRALLQPALDA